MLALLRRMGEDTRDEETYADKEKWPAALQEFLNQMKITLPEGRLIRFGDYLYLAPLQMPDIQRIRVLRPGLALGEMKKDRFEPAHALALWLKTAANIWDLGADTPQAAAYLHGETIPAAVKGWCLVTLDGYSIGWGKGDGNVLKNHYPKGLRR